MPILTSRISRVRNRCTPFILECFRTTLRFSGLLLCPAALVAQTSSEDRYPYVAHFTGLWTEHHEKQVSEAFAGWETIASYDVSAVAHRAKFIALAPVAEAELSARLSGTGVQVFWLAVVNEDGTLSGASYEQHAFPIFQDTGDPAADNARYEADKNAWLAAHPGWVDVNSAEPLPERPHIAHE